MRSILGDIGPRADSPQRERTPGRTDEVKNSAGGYVHTVDDWARLDRFLILGVDAGTYYTQPRPLALDNADVVRRCLKADGRRTVDAILNVSSGGRAPSNDPALFALAMAAACDDLNTRRYALANLSEACRTGTHLFHFVKFAQAQRGWGRGLAQAVARWYTRRTPDELAYQVIKYRQRDGWSHRDVLRQAHPTGETPALNDVLKFAARRDFTPSETTPRLIDGFIKMQAAADKDEAAELVREYGLPWETVPDTHLTGDTVWRALLETPNALPLGALVRKLGVLSNRGILVPNAEATRLVADRIADPEALKRSRIHPIALLNALVTYRGGVSRGDLRWSSAVAITDALDAAFYTSFGNVEPTGKRIMLALDCSASMTWQPCTGAAFDCREGAVAMAMVTDAVEVNTWVTGFCSDNWSHAGLATLDVSHRRRLDDNVRYINGLRAGGTDCALPMLGAIEANAEVDTFIIYTDNETWAGGIKPTQALERYREKSGIDARLIVVGMTSTGFTIADPNDPRQLDVVGFDTATPQVISEFT